MDRPGRVVAVQAKGGHKEFSLELLALEEEARALLRKDQRHRLRRPQPGILRDSYVHQIAIFRREERMEDGMIGEHKLEFFRIVFRRGHAAIGFETKFAQAAGDRRRETINEQQNATPAVT